MKNTIALVLLLAAGSSMAQDKFEIAGKLPGSAKDKIVVLSYKNSEGKDANDSSIVKSGKFNLKGHTAFGNKAYLTLAPLKKDSSKRETAADYQEFYLEKGKYKVLVKDSMKNASISGTQAQADFALYNSKTAAMLAQFRDISQRFAEVYYAKVKDTVLIKKMQAEAKPLYAKIEAATDSFIFSHPDSYVALELILENKTAVIDPVVFDPYYKALTPEVLASFNGQKLTDKYVKATQIALGKTVDFNQTDADGGAFRLASEVPVSPW